MQAEQWTDVITDHGEGPVWDEAQQALRLVDMMAGDVVTVSASAELVGRERVGSVAAALRPRVDGGWVIAVERGFALRDADGCLAEVAALWSDPSVRMNDGGTDPAGRFLCGSMAYDSHPGAGTLWALEPDLTTRMVLHDVTISNGIVWSHDGATMFYVDSPTHRVDRFDYDVATGRATGRRPHVIVEAEALVDGDDAIPDGMCIDTAGGLWVAVYGGGVVHHYDASGRLADVIDVGPRLVTACTFGGRERQELLITTSRHDLGDSAETAAGALFRVRTDVTGAPTTPFAG